MSRSIELSDATYETVEQLAAESGTTPAAWVEAEARRVIGNGAEQPPTNGDAAAHPSAAPMRLIELSDDVHARIEAEATAAGITVGEWIAGRAPRPCTAARAHGSPASPASANGSEAPAETRTLADRLAGRIGRLSSGRTDTSQRASELFAEGMAEKKKAGRL